ncbi:13597_t:CDS:1, partial [Dentiscutata erythropus]
SLTGVDELKNESGKCTFHVIPEESYDEEYEYVLGSDIGIQTENICLVDRGTQYDIQGQADEKMQTDSGSLQCNIEMYHNTIREIIANYKSESWDIAYQYIDDDLKLEMEFYTIFPGYYFYSKFEKMKMITMHKLNITEDDINLVRKPVAEFIWSE